MKMQLFRTGVVSAFAAGLIALGGGAALQKAEAASVKPASVTYKVTNSDTLYQIAKKYGIDLNALIKANPNLANPNFIWGGLIVNLPVHGGTGSGTPNGGTPNTGSGTNGGTPNTGSGSNGGTTAERPRRIKTPSPRKS